MIRSCLSTTLLAAFLAAAMPAGAQPVAIPPIVDPASQERHPGKVIFVQLTTPDLAAAKQFYGGLFGWAFHDVSGTRVPFAVAYAGGNPVAGLAQHALSPDGHGQPAWLSFFSTPDADATAKLAAGQGAHLLSGPRTIPGLGREAVLTDPQGAVFGLLASSSGDPPDDLRPSGAWIWRSLMTRDPTAAAGFYHALFGFETLPLPSQAGGQHLLLVSGHYARATANTPPAARPDLHPHWLSYVRVDSAAQSAVRAAQLGGRVLVPPYPDRHGGMITVVADPQGAPVGLFEWADSETKEIAR